MAHWCPAVRRFPFLVVIAPGLASLLSACSEPAPSGYQGYAEGEFVNLAAPLPGTLEKLHVARGQEVAAGAPVFALERALEQGAVAEAAARVTGAQARLANLGGGRRTPELDVIRAQEANAAAALKLSGAQLTQQQKLFASGFTSQARLDESRAARDRDAARVAEAEAQLRTALLSLGRSPEIDAARAEVAAATAAREQSAIRHAQKEVATPVAARVQETYFREGEWVPAGVPVVSLLPAQNIKVRFFVPQAVVGGLAPGRGIRLACDGCGAPIDARVTFVSTQAEYTPPVLYSRELRAKMVFMVEARPAPADAVRLHPGQPVDVALVEP
jgi:HlyD family secretion protein